MSRLFLFLLCLVPFQGWSVAEFEVRLKTTSPLTPIYLADPELGKSDLDVVYLRQLYNILSFDLSHAGTIRVLEPTFERETLAKRGGFQGTVEAGPWRQHGAAYLVKGHLSGKELAVRVCSTLSPSARGIDHLTLTGNLSEDRQTIHLLADAIHREMFGVPGIASTRILYSLKLHNPYAKSDQDRWISEIWECDYDGHNPRQLSHTTRFCVTPCYLKPKPGMATSTYLYVSDETGQSKMYVGALRGKKGQRLSYLRGNQLMPCLASSRDHLVFISDAAGNPDVFLQDFSPEAGLMGKPKQIFTSRYATQASPQFSPDGKKIVFVSNKDGTPKLYVMDTPGPNTDLKNPQLKQITKVNRENTAPAWSPDGSKIAYSAKTDGVRQIWFYDFRSDEEHQLTYGPGHKENASWAPNSRHLVFNSADGNSSELFLVNLNQAEAWQITRGRGEKRYPAWDPASPD